MKDSTKLRFAALHTQGVVHCSMHLFCLLCWLQQRHGATTAKFGHAQHILPLIKTSSVP